MTFEIKLLLHALAGTVEELHRQAAQAVRAAFSGNICGTDAIINGAAWIVTARNSSRR